MTKTQSVNSDIWVGGVVYPWIWALETREQNFWKFTHKHKLSMFLSIASSSLDYDYDYLELYIPCCKLTIINYSGWKQSWSQIQMNYSERALKSQKLKI